MHDGYQDMFFTVVAAVSVGILLIVFSRRLNLPAIVSLLFGGILLGPHFLNIVQPGSMGNALPVFVSLAVGLILFEGGLTLELPDHGSVPGVIGRLLTVGVLVTWLAITAAIMRIFAYPLAVSLLAASLVIVTGPTVISPILKRVKILPHLHSILHWEGVLIDPIGVFVALLCFEWIEAQNGQAAMAAFGLRFAAGIGMGAIGGMILYQFIHRRIVPKDMMNVFALAFAVLIFGATEWVVSDAGLLSVTVAGFIIGIKQPEELKELRQFKAEITDLMVGMLFILLAARLDIMRFVELGTKGVLLIAIVILVVRPLNIILSTIRGNLRWQDKAFLSWMAPRGIVTASMASLFAIRLEASNIPHAQVAFLETFAYSVMFATVLLQGTTAGPLASILGLKRPPPTGWLIIGAHAFACRIGQFIQKTAKQPVVMLDINPNAVIKTRAKGMTVLHEDARNVSIIENHAELQGIGNLLAITDNEAMNELICSNWQDIFGTDHVFQWCSATPNHQANIHPPRTVFSNLPKPAILNTELLSGDAHITTAPYFETSKNQGISCLACFEENKVLLDPGHNNPKTLEIFSPVLILQRAADYLPRALEVDLIMTLEADALEGLFEKMIDQVVRAAPRVDRQRLIKELIEREAHFPTVLGHGVAVPHAFTDRLEKRICAIARVPSGVNFGAPDEEQVRIVFLLLSPTGDPEGHLATMAQIARLVSEQDMRQRILQVSPSDLEALIRSHCLTTG